MKNKKNELLEQVKIGVIGGSGVYNIEEIKDIKEIDINTPFGKPSDKIIIGTLENIKIAFLPRHGKGHRILPSEINQRANIYALKLIGVQQIIGISACGSLKEELKPGDFILPEQIFDRTKTRISTFFGNGIVGHIGFANPFCNELRNIVYDCCNVLNIKTHFGGIYVCIEGPQFSTRGESEVNRKLGFDVVGMTALPEAKLAREAEICYATVGLITDYDVWKQGEEVSVEKVSKILHKNVENVKKLIKTVVLKIAQRKRECECKDALKYAIFTDKNYINKTTLNKLKLITGKYL